MAYSPNVPRPPSLLDAILPLVVLIGLIGGSVFLFGLGAIDGPLQVALLLSAMVAALIALKNGHPWSEISAAGGRAVASPLVPWNSCGAFMAVTLGVSTFLYFPFAIFNIVSPILSLLYGITGFKIDKLPPDVV